MAEHGMAIIKKCLLMALSGDRTALRMCMERVFPVAKVSGKGFFMPPVKTAADLAAASERVTQAAAQGKITAQEGDAMTNILEKRRRMLETEDLERRVVELERRSGVALKEEEPK